MHTLQYQAEHPSMQSAGFSAQIMQNMGFPCDANIFQDILPCVEKIRGTPVFLTTALARLLFDLQSLYFLVQNIFSSEGTLCAKRACDMPWGLMLFMPLMIVMFFSLLPICNVYFGRSRPGHPKSEGYSSQEC